MVDLAHHGVLVKAQPVDGKARCPVVIAERGHLLRVPALLTRVPIQQVRAHQVMTIAEDIRFHAHLIAHYTLHGKAAAIDLRRHAFHHHAAAAVHRLVRCCCRRL